MAPLLSPALVTTAAWAFSKSSNSPPTASFFRGPLSHRPSVTTLNLIGPFKSTSLLMNNNNINDYMDEEEGEFDDLRQVLGQEYDSLYQLYGSHRDLAQGIHEVEFYRSVSGASNSMLDKIIKIITLTPEFWHQFSHDQTHRNMPPVYQTLVDEILAVIHSEILLFEKEDQSRIVAALWVPFALDVHIDSPTLDVLTEVGFQHYIASKTKIELKTFELSFQVWSLVIPSLPMQEFVQVWNDINDPHVRASIKREVMIGLMTEIWVTKDSFNDSKERQDPMSRAARTQQCRAYTILVPLSKQKGKLDQLKRLNDLEQQKEIKRVDSAFHSNTDLDTGTFHEEGFD